MILAGTLINTGAILLGGGIGLLLKGKIPEKFSENIMRPLGLCVIVLGIFGAIKGDLLLIVASLALGAISGELLRIEEGFNKFGGWLQKKLGRGDNPKFAEGFITATLLFCVGAMAILGPIQSVLYQDYSTIITKSILDFISALLLSSMFGSGVLLAAAVVFVYQGTIEVLASSLQSFLASALITQISAVGSVMILAIGLKMALNAKFKTANMLPAFLFAIGYYFLFLV